MAIFATAYQQTKHGCLAYHCRIPLLGTLTTLHASHLHRPVFSHNIAYCIVSVGVGSVCDFNGCGDGSALGLGSEKLRYSRFSKFPFNKLGTLPNTWFYYTLCVFVLGYGLDMVGWGGLV